MILSADVIKSLRNFSYLFDAINRRYAIDFKEYFRLELGLLDELAKDGIVEVSCDAITVTSIGQQFVNIVCARFDRYKKHD